ncbi:MULTISPECIES: hypothetical protein [Actinosynnema]|uniref:hypothetical protein n=1 Tax=Actinosynnema TaxID=40566 RepID=UPI0020A26E5C|nr:hypothetical protein [Actinosynnema pretiosum]MCP2093449.1 hypothetical protein [Actinosynnema pretiosum]
MTTDEDLSDLPGPLRAELTRLRAERVVFVAEREKLLANLRETDGEVRALIADRDRLANEVANQPQRARESQEQEELVDALRRDVADVERERDSLRQALADTRAERDRLRLRLLDAELALEGDERGPAQAVPVAPAGSADRIAVAEARAAHLARELAATRSTVSWRVTAPLRAVRKKTR